jgi:hypothetical protein
MLKFFNFKASLVSGAVAITVVSFAFVGFAFDAEASDAFSGDFNFQLPSSLTLMASSSNDDTKALGADLNVSLHGSNRQISAGDTRSKLELNGDQFSFNEFRDDLFA